MIDKYKETLEIFKQEVEVRKPYMNLDYDFEKLEPYLSVFDDVPLKEKTRYIEYLVQMAWSYSDYKQKGIEKKSITKLESTVEKYQEVLRDLHNFDVSDSVIFHNGGSNNYHGEFDYDDDFETSTHLWHLSGPLQHNYLTNIELLKEIKEFKDNMEMLQGASISLGLKKPSMELKNCYFENKPNKFKIIDPLQFIETHRPSKEHIKNTLYEIATEHNLNKYEMKQLIDSI